MRPDSIIAAASESTDTTGPRVCGRGLKPAKYRRHKRSGQALVTIGGKDFYLGPWNSAATKAEYRRRLAEWNVAGCPKSVPSDPSALTVVELIERHWKFVKGYYSASATPESTIKPALRRLRLRYGNTLAADFGPLALKAFQAAMIEERFTLKTGKEYRLARPYINRASGWVRRMSKWAVSEQLVSESVYNALATVEGLKIGRSNAPHGRRRSRPRRRHETRVTPRSPDGSTARATAPRTTGRRFAVLLTRRAFRDGHRINCVTRGSPRFADPTGSTPPKPSADTRRWRRRKSTPSGTPNSPAVSPSPRAERGTTMKKKLKTDTQRGANEATRQARPYDTRVMRSASRATKPNKPNGLWQPARTAMDASVVRKSVLVCMTVSLWMWEAI